MIFIIGNKGSMGRRYSAILKYLNIEFGGVDISDSLPDGVSKALVCTPTETHIDICSALCENGIDFLCEKPVSKNPTEIKQLELLAETYSIDARVVDNWRRVEEKYLYEPGCNRIYYNNYNTGKDGLLWDCIQLVYLSYNNDLDISTEKPFFEAKINGMPIFLSDVEMSYIRMVKNWLFAKPCNIWTLKDAYLQSKIINTMEGK